MGSPPHQIKQANQTEHKPGKAKDQSNNGDNFCQHDLTSNPKA
jgi:hypothetical protein